MSTPTLQPDAIEPEAPVFGPLLRQVRAARRLSQLDLASQAQISQRHLSFLESGRARPSRAMVLQLAESLDLPLRLRNRLLVAAGLAPEYPQRPLDSAAMAPVRLALERLLAHHEPYPALVVDRAWNLAMSNAALERLLGLLGPVDALWARVCGDGPRNMLRLTFHPQGLRPLIANMDEIGAQLLARARIEALEEPSVARVLESILADCGIPARWQREPREALPPPLLATELRAGPLRLSLFTMLSTFGTPQDLTTDTLRVEHLFPADEQTEALLRQLAGPDVDKP